jgi:hypothetical protein
VGAKLENVITRLAQEAVAQKSVHDHEAQQVTERKRDHETARVKLSDEHFWFGRPAIVLYLIQFILFQNSFEIAFFFWILVRKCTYISARIVRIQFESLTCNCIFHFHQIYSSAEHIRIQIMHH